MTNFTPYQTNITTSPDTQPFELRNDLKDCLRISVRPFIDEFGIALLWLEMHYPNGVKHMAIQKNHENELLISEFLTGKGVFGLQEQTNAPEKSFKLKPNPMQQFTLPVLRKRNKLQYMKDGNRKASKSENNSWCLEFYFYDETQDKKVRFRLSNQLNRIKDTKIKLSSFKDLQKTITKDLKEGWNPITNTKPVAIEKLNELRIGEAINNFLQYNTDKGNRKNTITSYQSKLKLFLEHIGNLKVKDINDLHITDFLNTLERNKAWTAVTYNYAKRVLNNLFVYLIRYKHVNINPTTNLEGRKEIKTVKHQVFSDEDFTRIMAWLKVNDPYCLLFVQTIYYTCIRPRELRHTQLEFIDLMNNRIIIPASVAKNKKAIPVKIDPALKIEFSKLDIDQYPNNFYLFGDKVNIIGPHIIGVNKPYNRFQACLAELNLTGKNYTLYSFKHLSNVRKYLAGWTVAEICSANRHSSLVETETYLKDLVKFLPATKTVPEI